jgi:hypothetical protein
VSKSGDRGVYEHAFNFTEIHGYTALDAVKFVEVLSGETKISDMQK